MVRSERLVTVCSLQDHSLRDFNCLIHACTNDSIHLISMQGGARGHPFLKFNNEEDHDVGPVDLRNFQLPTTIPPINSDDTDIHAIYDIFGRLAETASTGSVTGGLDVTEALLTSKLRSLGRDSFILMRKEERIDRETNTEDVLYVALPSSNPSGDIMSLPSSEGYASYDEELSDLSVADLSN